MSDPKKRAVTFVHTSAVAISPLMQFYGQQARELEITNLLDDGVMRYFSLGEESLAQSRFEELISTATHTYHAELIMLTCSTVSKQLMGELRRRTSVTLLKIDEPMARKAIGAGSQVGVVVTFSPTVEPTRALLLETAKELGKTIELKFEVLPAAYDALLAGDQAKHDQLLIDGVGRLVREKVDAIVLAQVSMARAQPLLEARFQKPIFSSLRTSLDAIRNLLERST
jgi:hypothetical protein